MAKIEGNTIEFGRVVYVEPNNNINGSGKGTNFTFNPEDYSILVDLQVEITDRYSANVNNGNENIELSLKWNGKGTKTSMFKGTNGMLTARAMDTSFDDIINNYNQEAIGINSIDIRYNSWNYPEITIQFTDVRGASLLSSADYVHTVLAGNENKAKFADNFANTFFSTFFRFPYPRYTLVVKGFYGRPVSYTLCVNDFKTRFNSSTGNFDVTVSFIGYMYGLMTDIPMRLLFVAPYSEYNGRDYWIKHKNSGDFCYQNSETPMFTFLELEKMCDGVAGKLKEEPEIVELYKKKNDLEKRKSILSEINMIYANYLRTFTGDKIKYDTAYAPIENRTDATDVQRMKYVVIYKECSTTGECINHERHKLDGGVYKIEVEKINYAPGGGVVSMPTVIKTTELVRCDGCDGKGYVENTVNANIGFENDLSIKTSLWTKVKEYNEMDTSWGVKIPPILRVDSDENVGVSLNGHIAYKAVNTGKQSVINSLLEEAKTSGILVDVQETDKKDIIEYLNTSGVSIANSFGANCVAVCILKVGNFESAVNGMLSDIDTEIKNLNQRIEEKQNEVCKQLLGFDVTLKNVIDMCLAHLDTFIVGCMYNCINQIGKDRTFSQAPGLSVTETDVQSKQDSSENAPPLFLPPFFGYKRKNKDDMFEDAWIGSDPKFSNRDVFEEIKLVDGLINGALYADKEAEEVAANVLGTKAKEVIGAEIGENYIPTFVNDFYLRKNPYDRAFTDSYETIIAMFAFRCLLGTVYGLDYPEIGRRFDDKGADSERVSYFEFLGGTDADNFSKTDSFDTFRKGSLASAFKQFTWDDFKNYITGNGSTIIPEPDGQLYNRGNMTSPLFTYKDGYFVASYGNEAKGRYMIPLNYTTPQEAVEICENIDRISETGAYENPETNGFGVNRLYAMPVIDIQKGGISTKEQEEVEANFDEKIKKGDCRKIGWYFRNTENWAKYFSGAANNESVAYFPSLFATTSVNEAEIAEEGKKKPETTRGVLYNRQNGEMYAILPPKNTVDARNFFVSDESGVGQWFKRLFRGDKTNVIGVNGKESNNEYIEKTTVNSIINDPENVTAIGLLCGDGGLFESEFYAAQGTSDDNKEEVLRRAFLFLHSLPTSEYGALSHVLSTITKRTYAPSITDIPYASALFIGGLFYRHRNGEFIRFPSGYEIPTTEQLITYSHANASQGMGGMLQKNIIRRPLNPIRTHDSRFPSGYLTVENQQTKEYVEKLEKEGFENKKSKNLQGWLEDNESGAYVGFWDIAKQVQDKFIDLFLTWATGSTEFTEIERDLALRNKNGQRMSANDISNVCNAICNYNGKDKFNGTTYNDFIKNTFSDEMCAYHMSLAVSNTKKDLFTMFRVGTTPVKKITNLMSTGCMVRIAFPRVLVTRESLCEPVMPKERESIRVSEAAMQAAWNAFKSGIEKYIEDNDKKDKDNESIVQNNAPSSVPDGVKLTLYETLKNLYDKWLICTDEAKYKYSATGRRKDFSEDTGNNSISNNFFYINSFHEHVGDEITLNIDELPKQIRVVKNQANDNACSFYSFMYDIAQQARVQLLALPIFNDLSDPAYVRQMFTPMPFDNINIRDANTETYYVFMYPEEASKQLNLPHDEGTEQEQYKFIDDSFMLVTEAGLENRGDNVPSTFWDRSHKNPNVPVIGVTFAKQNQSFFKNINVSMDNPRTTDVAINNTFMIAEKYNRGNSQVTALGQDLFSIYSNYSYECTVEMMGCACIMPLMYFQLNNIPMFKGTYIIYNVSHSITPGNMTTTFTGQRLSRYRKMRNKDGIAVVPNDNAYLGNYGYGVYGTQYGSGCYTSSGVKLEHEDVYNSMADISGVSDKAALRAVEYAETHYTGGFFNGNKLKVYYDPYMARVDGGILRQDISVANPFETSYVTPNDFDGNMKNINAATSIAGGDKIQVKDALAISSLIAQCCTYGAFGIPGKYYSNCGADSISTFWNKSSESFGEQGNYFAVLLKNNTAMRDALSNKDWDKFANLYKTGVYMPGDEGFKNYISDLKTGYREASEASAENSSKYIPSAGQDLHLTGPDYNPHAAESQAYADAHPFNVKAAVTSLMNKSTGVYVTSACGAPKWTIDYSTTVNGKTLKGDGTKEANYPISRCATYVKLAMAIDGKVPCKSCSGGFCGPILEREGWEEIYRSRPGDPMTGPEIDSKWQPGDIMTIEGTDEKKDPGHIAMWCGTNWYSDFKQGSCLTYSKNMEKCNRLWNAGKYHFWRYRNRTNM